MEDYPHVSSYKDRHGKRRYSFRKSGKSRALPQHPGHPEFEEAYKAAVEGREPRKASVTRLPSAALPETFGAAWRLVQTRSAQWKSYKPATKTKNIYLTEMFLKSPIVPTNPDVWGDMKIADLKRRHVKHILATYADTPHKAKHLLVAIRRLIDAALDEEWIEADPTYKIKWSPKTKGHRAWTLEQRRAYEQRWPVGSTPRLVYSIALWAGLRRSDIAKLQWIWIRADKIRTPIVKGEKALVLPICKPLKMALDATTPNGPSVVTTQYGKPFSEKSLTGRMADWTRSAGLEPGCTLHGLRKTLGKYVAEAGGSTRESMAMLGHDDMEQAELYSREADQEMLAESAMNKVVKLFG
ncbi:MAG: tyrosine-type recombinase/integrase [Hyphomicrobiales bacterium]